MSGYRVSNRVLFVSLAVVNDVLVFTKDVKDVRAVIGDEVVVVKSAKSGKPYYRIGMTKYRPDRFLKALKNRDSDLMDASVGDVYNRSTVSERDLEMYELMSQGMPMGDVGKKYGISRQRVKQVQCKLRNHGYEIHPRKVRQREFDNDKYAATVLEHGEYYAENGCDPDLLKWVKAKLTRKRNWCKSNGVEFDLKVSDMLPIPKVCPALGIPLNINESGHKDNSLSFDRIDPTKGYVKGNVALVSFRANRIKSDAHYSELLKVHDYYKEIDGQTT